jgi:hypothetical protein
MRYHHFAVALLLLVAPPTLACPALANVLISIDKSAQRMTVSVDGSPLYSWPVSTGMLGRETPNGWFQPFRMEEDHYSKEWDDAPMPHSIFFTKVGHAIHGSLAVRRLGTPASHGCVRISPANAAKLYALVQEEGLPKTRVIVTGTEPAPATIAKRGTRAAKGAVARAPDRDPYEVDDGGVFADSFGERSYDGPADRAYQAYPHRARRGYRFYEEEPSDRIYQDDGYADWGWN